jgi:hypothetical protein
MPDTQILLIVLIQNTINTVRPDRYLHAIQNQGLGLLGIIEQILEAFTKSHQHILPTIQ